jgi:molybdopterin synthase catalytic subunit
MIALVEGPIDVAALLSSVQGSDHGGSTLFLGSTRDTEDRSDVVALDYEAYPELAEREIRRICEEAAQRFGARLAVAHRLGRVAAGEASVAVAASAKHRGEAFTACRYVIDELKIRVPIWKRVVHADGQQTWGIPGVRG